MLDSKAVFASRASERGASEAELASLTTMNADTLGTLAFAAPYQPGQADDEPFL